MTQKLPYVVLKTATTMDGKIAASTGNSKWITSEKARKEVYKMRKEFDCILTSSNTILADKPKMEHKFNCILDKEYIYQNIQNVKVQIFSFLYLSFAESSGM